MYVCLSGKGLEQERSIRYTCQALEQRRIKKIEFFFPSSASGNSSLWIVKEKRNECLR